MAEPSTTAVAALVSAIGGVIVTLFGITPQSFFAALVASALAAVLVPAKSTDLLGRAVAVFVWFLTIIVSALFAHGVQSAMSLSSAVENALAAIFGFVGPFVWKAWIEKGLEVVLSRFKGSSNA